MQIKNAEQAAAVLNGVTAEPGRWMATVNTMLVDIYKKLDAIVPAIGMHHNAIPKLHADLKSIAQAMGGAVAAQSSNGAATAMTPAAGMPPRGGARLAADGNPITDPTQLEAEALMDAAAGPAPGGGAAPPASDGVFIGADGQPITDPAQIEAERAMMAATS